MVRPACHTSLSYTEAYKEYINKYYDHHENIRGYNICVSDWFNSIKVGMHKPVTIPSDNLWYCFDVVFNIEAPHPDNKYW